MSELIDRAKEMTPNCVIFASYGNDSVALIQWAHENALSTVCVLYSDTGWAADWWAERVSQGEELAKRYGFMPVRTSSVGLEQLVKDRKGWPRQGMQFCTSELKIAPSLKWLDEHDPFGLATCFVGVRKEESANRKDFPAYRPHSPAHGDRAVRAPLVDYDEGQRNALLARAGFDVLPHRSMECYPCVNANRQDLRLLDEQRIAHIERIETSMGRTSKDKPRTMFRPYRHMGATGIRDVVRWANSAHGKFDPDDGTGGGNCDGGYCGT